MILGLHVSYSTESSSGPRVLDLYRECNRHSRSSTRGPEDDSVESKHVAPLSHYMFNISTVVFDEPSPTFISQILRDWTPQVQMYYQQLQIEECV